MYKSYSQWQSITHNHHFKSINSLISLIMKKNICVFCGASDSVDSKYFVLAERCGQLIAENNCNLVYGGSSRGMMGKLAQAASFYGSKVIGVFPMGILDEKEIFNNDLDEPIIVSKMHERKDIMIKKSDAFLILPGGLGTLDELFEIITLKNLETHNKPIVIVNYEKFWDSLIVLMNQVYDTGFASHYDRSHIVIVDSLEEGIQKLLEEEVK